MFGLPSKWVPLEYRVQAELAGNTVVDRSTLVVTHLAELVRRRAGRLLGRTDVKELIESVRATDPAVVEDLTATGITTAEIQRILATLLDDGVPIRDLVRILEAVGERARTVRSTEALVEAVRVELGPAITDTLAADGRLTAMTVSPLTEAHLAERLRVTDQGSHLELLPTESDALASQVIAAGELAAQRGGTLAVVCAAVLRPALAATLRNVAPMAAVVSYAEVGDHLRADVVAQLDLTAGTPGASRPGPPGGDPSHRETPDTREQEDHDELAGTY